MLRKIIIIAATACALFYAALRLYAPADTGRKILVDIAPGMTGREIARLLHDRKVISNPRLFLAALSLTGRQKSMKAGVYTLSKNQSIWSVMRKLASGVSENVRITVPEGFTAEDIGRALERSALCDADEFIQIAYDRKLEGYLFPDTYYFEPRISAETVIDVMQRNFYANFTDDFRERAYSLGMSAKDIVTLASLIEKEAQVPQERTLISAVFHNRLKKRMYLESCASVLYAMGRHKKRLLYKDLQIDSPYNTYRNYGLPPGPICNPGRASLKAALYPAESKVLFFISNNDGTHTFFKTYGEHIRFKRTRKSAS